MSEHDSHTVDLGRCCQCGSRQDVRTIIMADGLLSPIRGRGWACLQCGLPPDGATFVLCDVCCLEYTVDPFEPHFACRGYPGSDGRIPYADLERGNTAHDMARHPGEMEQQEETEAT